MTRVAALAVMLMTLVVAQAPIAQVDHWLHATGQAHVATPLASALLDEHHDHDPGQNLVEAQGDSQPDGSTAPPLPHHHHDVPSAVALPLAPTLTEPWTSFVELTPTPARRLDSASGQRQDRPPRITLEHLA